MGELVVFNKETGEHEVLPPSTRIDPGKYIILSSEEDL
jgi:hypothetical protein